MYNNLSVGQAVTYLNNNLSQCNGKIAHIDSRWFKYNVRYTIVDSDAALTLYSLGFAVGSCVSASQIIGLTN